LIPEWSYKSADNFEWCVNAPAVDGDGNVYGDSEDGNLYVIKQGGTVKGKIFLQKATDAAYTPVSIGRDGKIYTLNNGDMFALGK
jgi:outer membrane protein assembly factor BamB